MSFCWREFQFVHNSDCRSGEFIGQQGSLKYRLRLGQGEFTRAQQHAAPHSIRCARKLGAPCNDVQLCDRYNLAFEGFIGGVICFRSGNGTSLAYGRRRPFCKQSKIKDIILLCLRSPGQYGPYASNRQKHDQSKQVVISAVLESSGLGGSLARGDSRAGHACRLSLAQPTSSHSRCQRQSF